MTSGLYGQTTVTNAYFPIAGDTLFTAIDDMPEGITVSAAGGDQTWNFSNLTADVTRERVVQDAAVGEGAAQFPSASLLINQATGAEGYYQSTDTEFGIIGYFGEDPLGQGIQVDAPFDPAYVERWAPLNFFDLNENESSLFFTVAVDDIPGNIFDNLPISPDSIRVRVNTDRTDLVDGWGSLSIPGGTYDVLREKRTEARDVRLEAKIGFLPWADVTDIALEALPIDELGEQTLVTYTFWSNEAKEPIAILNVDPEDETVNTVEFKYNGVISSVAASPQLAPSVLVYPNPAITFTNFEFNHLEPGYYRLDIMNVAGSKVWSKPYYIGRNRTVKVDISDLRRGVYLYALQDEQGNRIAVNRLLVMNP